MTAQPSAQLTTAGGTRCPACAGSAAPAADAGGFTLYACGDCGSWSSDALARSATTSFTPSGYFDHADADRPRWRDLVARAGRAPRAVLDVGCGTGAFLAFLAGEAPAATLSGIELDAGRAALARAANPRATLHVGDAAGVSESLSGEFDLITLWDVLEHVSDPARLLRALAARLAPDGLLFVQTIHEASLLPRLGRLSYSLTGGRFRAGIRRTHDAHHLVFFTRAGLGQLAAGAGLGVQSLWFDRLALDRMDGSPLLTWPAAALMRAENAWGNGLFVNALLRRAAGS
jgi:2-polyprenyl-3-methyl-5-hydroxy-6-metoxy-1,4-benzoquinol methylase